MPITLRTIAQSTLQGPTGPAGAAGTAGVTGPTGPSVTGPTGPGGVVPKVSSVSITDNSYTVLNDTAVDTSGGYIKVTGSGFTAGCSVLVGTTPATSTTFISESEVRAQVPAQSAGTYIVYVVNSDGGTATRVNGITYSASPTWTTASALPNATSNVAYTQALMATGATSYSLQAGSSLPSGMTLSSGGSLSGTTVVANNTSYSFTVLATDAELQDSPRTFTLNVIATLPKTFSISPAVDGKSTWSLVNDGPLILSSEGSWTITPTSEFQATVKMWGAGGGGANAKLADGVSWGNGGGGGAATSTVTFGAVSHVIRVGQGGRGSSASADTFAAAAGGGKTGWYDGNWGAGGGGAYSGIFRTSETFANAVLIAGGGGGGGFDRSPVNGSATGGGGGGPGVLGQNGRYRGSSSSTYSGKAGTESAGGAGGASGGIGTGNSGSQLQGADAPIDGSNQRMGSGGGSGYYGGGGGTYAEDDIAGAGGGSGYANPSYTSSTTGYAGSLENPGNIGDADRGTAGTGGTGTRATNWPTNPVQTYGNPGKIIIY